MKLEANNDKKLRKPTKEEKEQFKEVDKSLDKVKEKDVSVLKQKLSNIDVIRKTFMKISDVDVEDAAWFKEFADKYTSKHQFLGIKVIRAVMERLDPTLLNAITELGKRVERLENIYEEMTKASLEGEEEKIKIPKGQGKHRKMRDLRGRYRGLTGKVFEEGDDITIEELEKMIEEEEEKKK